MFHDKYINYIMDWAASNKHIQVSFIIIGLFIG